MSATTPDITFERDQVEKICLKCHRMHKISAEELAKYQSHPVWTDCRGSHGLSRLGDQN